MPMATLVPKSGDQAAEVTCPTLAPSARIGQARSQRGTASPSMAMARICCTGPSAPPAASASRPMQPMARRGVAEPAQPAFMRGVVVGHVVAIAQQARPRSARSGWGSRRAPPDPPRRRTAPPRSACRYRRPRHRSRNRPAWNSPSGRRPGPGPGTGSISKRKNRMSRTASPKTRAIRSSAFGPCTASGDTSGSSTSTSSR